MSFPTSMQRHRFLFLAAIISLPIGPALSISRTDFFERLEQSMARIQTFESEVLQESRYPDGLVQRYSGRLSLFDDGRIAYHYDLVGEYEDPSIATQPAATALQPGQTDSASVKAPSSGRIFAKEGLVRQYDADKDLVLEGTEDSNLLIQVFRTLVGSGDFDIEKFKEEHSISVDETTLDGVPVFKMVASPKKKSELFKKWSSQTRNELMNWNWELWVRQTDMQPMRAVLQSHEESTAIQLNGTRVNEPMNEAAFALPQGAAPKVVRKQSFGGPPSRQVEETRVLEPEPPGLVEIPTE